MTEFKQGDIVRVKKKDEQALSDWRDMDLTVVASDDIWTTVEEPKSKLRRDRFYSSRFEKVPFRRDGSPIKVENVKEGDEILVTWATGGMSCTRQGVVSEVMHATGWNQDNWVLYVPGALANGKQRLYASETMATANLTLVKAAPEVDPVHEALLKAEDGSVIEFELSARKPILARKKIENGNHRWSFFWPTGVTSSNLEGATEALRPYFDSVVWLR